MYNDAIDNVCKLRFTYKWHSFLWVKRTFIYTVYWCSGPAFTHLYVDTDIVMNECGHFPLTNSSVCVLNCTIGSEWNIYTSILIRGNAVFNYINMHLFSKPPINWMSEVTDAVRHFIYDTSRLLDNSI